MIEDIFKTPVYSTQLDVDNDKLWEECLEIKRKWHFTKRLFFNAGARFLAGYAKPKIINGYVETYPIGFHIVAGLGVDFYKKTGKCLPCDEK